MRDHEEEKPGAGSAPGQKYIGKTSETAKLTSTGGENKVLPEPTNGLLQPDTSAAVDFLRRWKPHGPWALVAIKETARGSKRIEGKFFTDLEHAEEWIAGRIGSWNLYFHVNSTREKSDDGRVIVKAERKDVVSVEWLHVDIDARAGEPLDTELERIRDLLGPKRPSSIPPPTVIVFSGGGYQAFWRLREPIQIGGDVKKADEIGLYNLQLEILLKGDHCHDISRIMRLPGTINFPDKRKRDKGRVTVLALLK